MGTRVKAGVKKTDAQREETLQLQERVRFLEDQNSTLMARLVVEGERVSKMLGDLEELSSYRAYAERALTLLNDVSSKSAEHRKYRPELTFTLKR